MCPNNGQVNASAAKQVAENVGDHTLGDDGFTSSRLEGPHSQQVMYLLFCLPVGLFDCRGSAFAICRPGRLNIDHMHHMEFCMVALRNRCRIRKCRVGHGREIGWEQNMLDTNVVACWLQ